MKITTPAATPLVTVVPAFALAVLLVGYFFGVIGIILALGFLFALGGIWALGDYDFLEGLREWLVWAIFVLGVVLGSTFLGFLIWGC